MRRNSYLSRAPLRRAMRRREIRDYLVLMAKSVLVILGGILIMAGLVDLVVDGPDGRNLGALGVGLLLAVPPVAFAFREAVRAGRAPVDPDDVPGIRVPRHPPR